MKYLLGDCREVLCGLDAGSVQCCVTSPPYYGLRDYGVDGQIGLEPSPDEYVAAMVAVFREVRRVLRDDGTLWLNIGDSYNTPNNRRDASAYVSGGKSRLMEQEPNRKASQRYDPTLKPKDMLGIPWMLAFALRADGWYLRSDIIWHKPNPMPESVRDRPTSAHEHVFLLTKGLRYFYDAEAIMQPAAGSSVERMAQDVDSQEGSARANGGTRADRPMKAVMRSSGNKARKLGDERGRPESHMGGSVPWEGATANARNVWTIATRPYTGAHFATMPPDLAERCIKAGTSERGACPHCGAPWARVVERRLVPTAAVSFGTRPDERDACADAQDQGSNRVKDGHVPGMANANLTTGWAPSCSCPAHEPVPCTVLDPFGGAGTTGLVADRLGRQSLLIDLSENYRAMAEKRLLDDRIKRLPKDAASLI
jgi:DNA modification methylase